MKIIQNDIPEFIINNKKQKGGNFINDILIEDLEDISMYFTGSKQYTLTLIDEVNIGRLGIIKYNNIERYISFSNPDLSGRNSAMQHVTSALSRFYKSNNENKDKEIYYYFLKTSGNYGIPYYMFYYRMMKTVGFKFINEKKYLSKEIFEISSVEDLINMRNVNKKTQNNSSYLTLNADGNIDFFAKTYGANKKESVLIACAAAKILKSHKVIVYEMIENNLKELPKPDKELMKVFNITIIRADKELEKQILLSVKNYRSPKFNMNLLKLRGQKKCALCDCNIPQIIEGAHIWPVSEIKNEKTMNEDEKVMAATDGENGIWLCSNHHKLFDSNLLFINNEYKVMYSESLENHEYNYLNSITTNLDLSESFIGEKAVSYLLKRNKA
ncbi:Uncharacterised protein [Macrococcoides caseolyticum]|uniref:HNH endonuclease signature motif containing protein n=1 Tax=Macrococcoides caseolyticum TaxID=69966 RepID=UPI00116AE948|nr:HNH endonuclease signature motif containing protein [Macrococcus caseolyticus]VUC65562.1 Uncharacterised protein [Macrococcus caseolyticus]